MLRARTPIWWAVAGLVAGLLVLPAVAGAAASTNGGAAAPPSTPARSSTPASPSTPASSPTVVAGALSVAPASLLEHEVAEITGSVGPADAAQAVSLQVRKGKRWATLAGGVAAADGSFALAWRTNRSGQLTLRVVSTTGRALASTSSVVVSATPQVTLSVFQQVVATWYGPGFYGNHTACGETLTRHIVGVADRTLPCGTPVTLSYNGQTLTVPVIDRGPYSGAATLDLTHAAAAELGITETVQLGMLTQPGLTLLPTDWFPPSTGGPPSSGDGEPAATSIAGGATAPTGATAGR
jgi:rare lipoprotein A